MIPVTVRIPSLLREHCDGRDMIPVCATTVGVALAVLGASHERLLHCILGPDGDIRPSVNVFIGGRDVRELDGLGTALQPGDVIAIVPAAAGRAPAEPAGG